MENSEEVLQILERYTRLKQKEIPKELEEYFEYVAKTGDTVFKWVNLKYLFREKLLHCIKNFNDESPRLEEIPNYPNVDPFNYETMKSALLERLEMFTSAPFTIQRLCELLIEPRKQYTRIDKYMRALEKNILVVSTVDPGRKRTESENGDSLDSVVNGDLSLEVNIDIEMESDVLYINSEERNSAAAAAAAAVASNTISPLKSGNPRNQDEDNVGPKPKKIKLSVSDKNNSVVEVGNKSSSTCENKEDDDDDDLDSNNVRASTSDVPETPAEPDEEDNDEVEKSIKVDESKNEKYESKKNDETEDKVSNTSNSKSVDNTDETDDEPTKDNDKIFGKQDVESDEKETEDVIKDVVAPRTGPIESEQIASPSPEREINEEELEKPDVVNTLEDKEEKCEASTAAAKNCGVDEDIKTDEVDLKQTDDIKTTSAENAEADKTTTITAVKKADKFDKDLELDEKSTSNENVIKENQSAASNVTDDAVNKTENKTEDEQANKEKKTEKVEIPQEKDIELNVDAASDILNTAATEANQSSPLSPTPAAATKSIETDEPVAAPTEKVDAAENDVAELQVEDKPTNPEAKEEITTAMVEPELPELPQATSNIAADQQQPMEDEPEQSSPNAIEEVVMVELTKTDEPAGMEVDDTSQEAMDQ